jgi:predicted phosphodiesterase
MTCILPSQAQIKIGAFADCQYCDCDPAINRYYRNSLQKLEICITEFNGDKNIGFVVGLGDLIDRDFASFDSVNNVLKPSKHKVFHVTGNHDLEVEKQFLEAVPDKLNRKKTYYSVRRKNWQFIFLDGNEITVNSNDPEIVDDANRWINKLTIENQPNNKSWNGGISEKQLLWLEGQLTIAAKKDRNVVLFCHYPLLPLEAHALWNSKEVLNRIEKYDGVKAWINGHNHAGNYAMKNGIHFINLIGMVDTENENAYSTIIFTDNTIEIIGFGREVSRSLTLR